jgi:membrane protein DedA with SNARE-associated domain
MQPVIDLFQYNLHHIPLEIFVMIGTFIEEVISPIPSFLVLVPTGAAARAVGHAYWYLLILMVFSAIGRIAGSTILYFAAGKLEDAVLTKKRRIFDVSHQQIEQIGQRLGRGSVRDWITLFTLNAIPIFPTAALSLICGFLKINFKMFAFCSFFGTMINALIFMTIGYVGVQAAVALQSIELAGKITTSIIILAAVIWFIRYRKGKRLTDSQTPRQ